MPTIQKEKAEREHCYHCGDECSEQAIRYEGKAFCCQGCQTVYSILEQNSLCNYYDYDKHAGLKPKGYLPDKWEFLDKEDIQKQLLQFSGRDLAIVRLHIPGMHCTSCIYLLENLATVAQGVFSSEVDFLKKEISIKYNPQGINLRSLVETLCNLGYAPVISLNDIEKKNKWKADKSLIYRIGIAGFCFGNIMLLSLPEYFDMKSLLTPDFVRFFRWLSVLFILPVLFYSAWPYFRSAWYALRWHTVNMDLPIALGLAGLSFQSFYNVFSGSGGGFFDSMAGLVFFLLIGRFFQDRTYKALSFDRDYKSYFPLAVKRRHRDGVEESVKVTDLHKGDLMLIHHDELIPADSMLESQDASIDYSFVTGESEPEQCHIGQMVYAGGRNKGGLIRLRVMAEVSQSYLTSLWNAEAFRKDSGENSGQWARRSATLFTILVIVLAAGTAAFWQMKDPTVTMRAVTAVLIVACPCVLALAVPFTFGSFLRVFGRNRFYLKSAESIENLAAIDTIVFDKTGTLTQNNETEVEYIGERLSEEERAQIGLLASSSLHPISQRLSREQYAKLDLMMSDWQETVSQGVSARVNGNEIKLGKASFAGAQLSEEEKATVVSVNGRVKGKFQIRHAYRKDMPALVEALRKRFRLFLLSGDDDKDKSFLTAYFPADALKFRQSPKDKMQFIAGQKAMGHKVLMIGDGLNDAGALKESNFGITVTEDVNAFTPASDAILDAQSLGMLAQFAAMAGKVKRVLNLAFIFSGVYNLIGLSFAVRGNLQPWVAAILMPVSSISVVLYTHLVTQYYAKKFKL